jgi:hypothetical protein
VNTTAREGAELKQGCRGFAFRHGTLKALVAARVALQESGLKRMETVDRERALLTLFIQITAFACRFEERIETGSSARGGG